MISTAKCEKYNTLLETLWSRGLSSSGDTHSKRASCTLLCEVAVLVRFSRQPCKAEPSESVCACVFTRDTPHCAVANRPHSISMTSIPKVSLWECIFSTQWIARFPNDSQSIERISGNKLLYSYLLVRKFHRNDSKFFNVQWSLNGIQQGTHIAISCFRKISIV